MSSRFEARHELEAKDAEVARKDEELARKDGELARLKEMVEEKENHSGSDA